MSQKRKLLLSAATAVALMATFGSVRPTHAQVSCSASYVVQPGDNLYRIGLAQGVSWVTLQQLNNIADPNTIYAGEVLCLPSGTTTTPITPEQPTPPPPPPPPTGTIILPPAGVFPTIALSTYHAGAGDTITITGSNFPTNVNVDIFLTPQNTAYGTTSSGTATIGADGTLNTNFTIPDAVAGVPLRGSIIDIMVKDSVTGYFAFNWFYNTKP